MIKYTIFTPTYNRANLLHRVFNSIVSLNRNDIEWIIVDDGSTDNTSDIVQDWINISNFNITYIYQKNSGKHIAYNSMVKKAQGEFVFTIDSDDWLSDQAINIFEKHWNNIDEKEKEQLVGIVGLFSYENGDITGTKFPNPGISKPSYYFKEFEGVYGDKYGVNKLSILKEFPFPDDLGKFIAEGVIWNKIANHYKQYPVNDVFAIKEYQKNGLSDKSLSNRIKYSKASILNYYSYINVKRRFSNKYWIKATSNLFRFSIHDGSLFTYISKPIIWRKPLLAILSLITGIALYFKDVLKVKINKNE